MSETYFAIRDGAKRKAPPCAFMHYNSETGFEIDIAPTVSADEVPAFFVPFVERGELKLSPELSLRWVQERVPPPGRQNLGEILAAHGLNEYSELEFLRSGRGMSAQDSFVVEEIDRAAFEMRTVDTRVSRRKLLGEEIRKRRNSLDMSQRDLADMVGIDQPALSRIEKGKTNPTFDLLADIYEALSDGEALSFSRTQATLWDERRSGLHGLIEKRSPELAQIYRRLVAELESYSNESPSAFADSRIISHCMREFMNRFPDLFSDDSTLRGNQSRQIDAFNRLRPHLDELPSSREEALDAAVISSDLYDALLEVRDACAAGTSTNELKMRLGVSGKMDDLAAPVSAWNKAKKLAEKTAHVPRDSTHTIPTPEEYVRSLVVLENVVESQLGNIYDVKANLFDLIRKTNRVDAKGEFMRPWREGVQSFISLLGEEELRDAAFRELKNPWWLEALEEEGFFKGYAEFTEEDFGRFHPGPFLMRCMPYTPEKVLAILAELSSEGWMPTRLYLIEAAYEAPLDISKKAIDLITGWAKSGYGTDTLFWERSRAADLVVRLLTSETNEYHRVGKRLFQNLTQVRRQPGESSLYHRTSACVAEYAYEPLIERVMPLLTLGERLAVCKNAINTYMQVASGESGKLLPSRLMVWSLDDEELAEIDSFRRYLVPWIAAYKNAILEALETDPTKVSRKLLDNKPLILRTIMYALHSYLEPRENDDIDPAVLRMACSLCMKPDLLFDEEYEMELLPLLSDFANHAQANERERFLLSLLGWLDAWEREDISDSNDQERTAQKRRYLEFSILSVFNEPDLLGYLKEIRDERAVEFGENEASWPLFKPITVWGPNSPLGIDDFTAMGAERAIDWLREWIPTQQDAFKLVEYEGVARALASLIETEPDYFEGMHDRLKGLKLVYISGVVDGWKNALKAKKRIPLTEVLDLCEYVVQDFDSSADYDSGYDDGDDGFYLSLRSVAWLFGELLKSAQHELKGNESHRILALLHELRKRGLGEYAQKDAFEGADSVNASFNALGAIVLSDVVFWIVNKGEKYEEDKALAFALLEEALPDRNESMTDAAVLGMNMRWLQAYEPAWLQKNYERIFGGQAATRAQKYVLSLQLSAFSVNAAAYEFLKPALENAMQQGMDTYPKTLSLTGLDGFSEHVGYWLYKLFTADIIDIDDEMIERWQSLAGSRSIGNALHEICNDVRTGTGINEGIVNRVRVLWENIANNPAAPEPFLRGAFDLLSSHFYPPEWIKNALLAEAQTHPILDEMAFHFDDIQNLSCDDASWGIRLLRAAIEHDATRDRSLYGDMPHTLMRLYIDDGGSREDAILRDCKNELGRMGILDLDA